VPVIEYTDLFADNHLTEVLLPAFGADSGRLAEALTRSRQYHPRET
jgi:hypothetical protein